MGQAVTLRPAAQNRDRQFDILSALAMLLVVMGHVDEGMLTIGGLFPYYSFHIALFLFISGYFYVPEKEAHIGAYLAGKARRLLLPYFIWNAFYGLLVVCLRAAGFYIGNVPSLWTLFVEPFLSGHQFLYNAPAWFVPALFLTEAVNVMIRRLLRAVGLRNEWALMGMYLCLGFLVVWFSAGGRVYDWYRIPGRIMYMLPCYQMGRLYRERLKRHDTLPDWLYFGILLIAQLLLACFANGLAVSAAWVNGFSNGPVVPYITAATGIAFWLRVSRILEPALAKNRFFNRLGQNTYAVMLHQVLAFFVVKGMFALAGAATGWFADFDWNAFRTDVYYFYLPGGLTQFKMLYVTAGVALPLLLQRGIDAVWQRITGRQDEPGVR